eukprot:2758660-Amphidinium_carterae.1
MCVLELEERVKSKLAKIDWQLVVGKPRRKGCCAVLRFAMQGFPLKCANSFAVLEPELDHEEEEFYSAASADEHSPSAENEETGTNSIGEVFGVPIISNQRPDPMKR